MQESHTQEGSKKIRERDVCSEFHDFKSRWRSGNEFQYPDEDSEQFISKSSVLFRREN